MYQYETVAARSTKSAAVTATDVFNCEILDRFVRRRVPDGETFLIYRRHIDALIAWTPIE